MKVSTLFCWRVSELVIRKDDIKMCRTFLVVFICRRTSLINDTIFGAYQGYLKLFFLTLQFGPVHICDFLGFCNNVTCLQSAGMWYHISG